MKERWDREKGKRTVNAKADAFLEDLHKVCQQHGLSISHEDGHGAFIVTPYDVDLWDWLNEASIDMRVKEPPKPQFTGTMDDL